VPGSHHPEQNARLAAYSRRRGPARSEAEAAACQASFPGFITDTSPGDVIAFDLHTWHASTGGRDRLARTAVYQRCPETEPERDRTLRSVHDSFEQAFRGSDRDRYPVWRDWIAGAAAHPRRAGVIERMRHAGVLDLPGAGRLVTAGHEPAGVRPAGRSPAHGFCDDEATRRLLRSRPPRQALAWAAARLGGPVISARALRGGMSSAVHLLTVQDGTGRRQAVLRRYVRPELNTEDPGIAEREARALRVAETVGVPTPALLAVDPAGTEAGAPAVLMSRLPGRVDWWPTDTGC
jgi:hypothetical protein